MNPFKTISSLKKAPSPLITLLLLASVLLAACSGSRENRLEAALEMAGDNRASLENVIRHFEGDSIGLRDLTKGKEDRIFTYENGRQIWR